MLNRTLLPFVLSCLLIFLSPIAQAQVDNGEPDCSAAIANPATLWPPNHKFRTIDIEDIDDPDGDEVVIAVDCIMQDEPRNTTGDGNTRIDGRGLGESRAEVRSERRGPHNARFYHIGFTATDPAGASCTGAVRVGVAHDRDKEPLDEGPLFHSTEEPGEDCAAVLQNNRPVITSTPPLSVQELEPYDYQVEATDADGDPLTYSLVGAPEGMSIESVLGLIGWTPEPSQVGEHTVTVEVDDGNGGTDTQTYTLTVEPAPGNSPPRITSEPVTEVTAGEAYQYPVAAVDPDPGDVLEYSLAIAPEGMRIDTQSGLIEWLPTAGQAGDATVTVRVEDGRGGGDTQAFTVSVAQAPNSPPLITSSPVTDAVSDQPYEYQVVASDPDAGDVLVYELADAPAGMSIDAGSGLITWLPGVDDVGSVDVTVRVVDSAGASAEQRYAIAVEPGEVVF